MAAEPCEVDSGWGTAGIGRVSGGEGGGGGDEARGARNRKGMGRGRRIFVGNGGSAQLGVRRKKNCERMGGAAGFAPGRWQSLLVLAADCYGANGKPDAEPLKKAVDMALSADAAAGGWLGCVQCAVDRHDHRRGHGQPINRSASRAVVRGQPAGVIARRCREACGRRQHERGG
ncbi:putative sucrose-phosphate synthase 5 [Panicum miliaceum]|uniref:Sucrose-phosphate synthase 5 n=1 Tax=Panicum miliaceum TaxID=4540 RepID=A0A3L6TWI9_PANMI|nr:putative sucrose-phosphate synthase 5 [Panicum miliaceum]